MFFSHCLLLTLMLNAYPSYFVESANMNARNWLYRNLTDTTEYVKYLRPVKESYQTVEVGLRFEPFIHYLDYSSQELQLRGTMVMTWYDFRLSWNPDEYDDLDYIELPVTEIWRPELILYERLSKHSDVSFQTETDIVKVRNTGKVNWVTIASTRTFCSINVKNFPKDKHTCDVTFTTWLHQDNEQQLQILGKMDPCEIEHLTWRLTFTGLGGNDSLYRCHQYLQNQSYVRYIANLERLDTKFGMYTFVAPNICISLLSVFTICFPRGDSNGPAFGMMCLLALIIQLGTLYQVIPDTDFCKVGQSIAILTIAVAVVTVLSVINMVIEDVVSKMTDLRSFVLEKKKSSHDRRTTSNGDAASNPQNSDLDIERPKQTASCSNTPENVNNTNDKVSPKANSSDELESKKENPDKKKSEDKQSNSNNHQPNMMGDKITCTQNVIQKLTWFNIKIFVGLGFFVAIVVINAFFKCN